MFFSGTGRENGELRFQLASHSRCLVTGEGVETFCLNLVATVRLPPQPVVSSCIYNISSEYFLQDPESLVGGRSSILFSSGVEST